MADALDHADGCSASRTFTKCEAVVIERPQVEARGASHEEIEVVRMCWCGDCEAASYGVVGNG